MIKYAIIVIDMLNDFIYGDLKCEEAKKIIPKLKNLLNKARELKIPIIYANDAHIPGIDHEFKLWGLTPLKIHGMVDTVVLTGYIRIFVLNTRLLMPLIEDMI